MRAIQALFCIFSLLFSVIGYSADNKLTLVIAGMTSQQVVSIMGEPSDSATIENATLLLYTKRPTMLKMQNTIQHFIFLDNKLVEYGEKHIEPTHSAYNLIPATEQLQLWLAEQGKDLNPSAAAHDLTTNKK
ncbi:TPA: hypothetical protein ACHWKL_004649 [Providencia stuartii]|uniref:hypothetical protein n=1 Tax=Providencia stuartii TaxID=588 RepID=UPI0011403DB2|nr:MULTISPECIES: hypothetical protein [Providencia]MBN5560911.1 hypothetical protein [Providencia stuartii]MBN5599344.1 hypothetical protein [Providencia stuartii]MBN5603600.1 hypothetical protein [Providencia stuartii]MCL8323876.1 hypothetical protein [Providencia thailandensis]MDF4175393.1 hypothetical protein [Providencia thailandensis]